MCRTSGGATSLASDRKASSNTVCPLLSIPSFTILTQNTLPCFYLQCTVRSRIAFPPTRFQELDSRLHLQRLPPPLCPVRLLGGARLSWYAPTISSHISYTYITQLSVDQGMPSTHGRRAVTRGRPARPDTSPLRDTVATDLDYYSNVHRWLAISRIDGVRPIWCPCRYC